MGDSGVTEEDCAICRHWPAADRPSMRLLVERIPLDKPTCDECLVEWWRGCIVPLIEAPIKPTRH